MIRRKFALRAVAIATLSLAFAGAASAQTVLRFSHTDQQTGARQAAAELFAKKVEELTQGRYKVQVYCCSQLGNDPKNIEQLTLGGVDFTVSSTGSYAPHVGPLHLTMLPYLVANYQQGWTLESMGFNVQIMPLPEVYLAIQQGTVSGQENPVDTIYSNKFYEVAPNVTLTNHVYSPIPLAISEKTWQRMSPADQKAVTEAAKIAAAHSRDLIRKNDDNLLKDMSAKGAKVNRPALDPFRDSVQPVYAKAKEKYGADVDAFLKDAEQVRKTVK
jgi:TRAP-type C4-dicarboxylate transport system substrate-binding protein